MFDEHVANLSDKFKGLETYYADTKEAAIDYLANEDVDLDRLEEYLEHHKFGALFNHNEISDIVRDVHLEKIRQATVNMSDSEALTAVIEYTDLHPSSVKEVTRTWYFNRL